MPEYVVSYAEKDDWTAPKGEVLVSGDPSQDGAWLFVTEPAPKAAPAEKPAATKPAAVAEKSASPAKPKAAAKKA